MVFNYNYNKFLETIKETKYIHNSLNEILKYNFIYNSNKIEGSNFNIETLKMLIEKDIVIGGHYLDDIHETINSFHVFDLVIDSLGKSITLDMIKQWHKTLMYRTSLYDNGLAGVFKKYPNRIIEVDFETTHPLEVEDRLNLLINNYNSLNEITIEDLLKFHLEFERIHPFQDSNGRIGRFIYLKQLLENKFPLRYMSGESDKEYKKALLESSISNVEPLINYINAQNDFIEENKNMF